MHGQLGAGEQHGQFRSCQPLAASGAAHEGVIIGQAVGGAVKLAGLRQQIDQAQASGHGAHPALLGNREAKRLQPVVFQHQFGHIIGHRDQ